MPNKYEEMELANEKLFDSPLKASQKLDKTWRKKVILLTDQYPKKTYRGLVVICATVTEEVLNCFIDTVIEKKRTRVFIQIKPEKGLLEIGTYNFKL